MKEDIDTLKYPFQVLKCLGLYSSKKSAYVLLMAFLYSIVMLFILCTTVMQLLTFNGNVFDFTSNVEELCAFGQHITKVYVITYQQTTFTHLVNLKKLFWSTELCSPDKQAWLNKALQRVMLLQACFFSIAGATVVFVIMSVLSGKTMLVGAWNSKGYDFLRQLVLISQAVVSPPVSLCTVAIDCIFLAFCAELIVQFRILCYRLSDLKLHHVHSQHDQSNYYNEMRFCIQHHVFLLKFLRDLQKTYSAAIFIEYLAITPTICSEMYAVSETDNLALLVRYAISGFSAILQLAFYCIPADYVRSEALLLSNAIYDNDWYTNYIRHLRKPVSFMIQISQREVSFTAGGLFQINARSLLNALKVSWSACTVMRAVKLKP